MLFSDLSPFVFMTSKPFPNPKTSKGRFSNFLAKFKKGELADKDEDQDDKKKKLSPEDKKKCLEHGMVGFLAKPVRLNQLQQALDEFLP